MRFCLIIVVKKDKVSKDTERDNFMSGEEAVKYGLIDKVIDKRDK